MIILREIQRHYWLSWHGVCVCVVAGAPDSASIYVKTSSETQDTPFWPEYCENLQQCHRHKWDPSMLCTIACRAMAVIASQPAVAMHWTAQTVAWNMDQEYYMCFRRCSDQVNYFHKVAWQLFHGYLRRYRMMLFI